MTKQATKHERMATQIACAMLNEITSLYYCEKQVLRHYKCTPEIAERALWLYYQYKHALKFTFCPLSCNITVQQRKTA